MMKCLDRDGDRRFLERLNNHLDSIAAKLLQSLQRCHFIRWTNATTSSSGTVQRIGIWSEDGDPAYGPGIERKYRLIFQQDDAFLGQAKRQGLVLRRVDRADAFAV
jgi:hypothetical protein